MQGLNIPDLCMMSLFILNDSITFELSTAFQLFLFAILYDRAIYKNSLLICFSYFVIEIIFSKMVDKIFILMSIILHSI
jgi:hypothetical protein